MKDKDYFSHLYEIASLLNKEYSLNSALRKSLAKTVTILGLETGWIWLTEPNNQSVYLATSYNLPPALSNYPERLSGWCYCINQYFLDDIHQSINISEMVCSRLKDIKDGTKGLKFHAVVPIIINKQKVGLINLLSRERRQLEEKELTILNTISELVGSAIQRTHIQHAYKDEQIKSESKIPKVFEKFFHSHMEDIISCLNAIENDKNKVKNALKKVNDFNSQFASLIKETNTQEASSLPQKRHQFPELPLSKRELEVLSLIREGLTNGQIGKQLFITERTVKFHVTSILSKLNAENRTKAVDISLKRGLFNI
ncbi:MAG: LuxR C-terminal-related transcriptional regulator [Saprospiraceae bacterium]|nr:LuxR C-terminal-related transcriptional regulator [Saprospiraceae bacterium]